MTISQWHNSTHSYTVTTVNGVIVSVLRLEIKHAWWWTPMGGLAARGDLFWATLRGPLKSMAPPHTIDWRWIM